MKKGGIETLIEVLKEVLSYLVSFILGFLSNKDYARKNSDELIQKAKKAINNANNKLRNK